MENGILIPQSAPATSDDVMVDASVTPPTSTACTCSNSTKLGGTVDVENRTSNNTTAGFCSAIAKPALRSCNDNQKVDLQLQSIEADHQVDLVDSERKLTATSLHTVVEDVIVDSSEDKRIDETSETESQSVGAKNIMEESKDSPNVQEDSVANGRALGRHTSAIIIPTNNGECVGASQQQPQHRKNEVLSPSCSVMTSNSPKASSTASTAAIAGSSSPVGLKSRPSDSCLVVSFKDCDKTIEVIEEVAAQFEYFEPISEGDFFESRRKSVTLHQVPYNIGLVVLQRKHAIVDKMTSNNLYQVIEALDYLSVHFDDEFVLHMYQRIHRHRWTTDGCLRKQLIRICARTDIGRHLLSFLMRSPGILWTLFSSVGGTAIAEMFEQNAEDSILLLQNMCRSLTSWQPSVSQVTVFLLSVTNTEHLVDAISAIWDPTLWYSTEKKCIEKDLITDLPVQMGDVDVCLTADADLEGSDRTVNITIENGSLLDMSTPLSQVVNAGVYVSSRETSTGLYNCFTARAKFRIKDTLVGVACFDLYHNGVKAFCPVISGGPHKCGLLLTCKIDEKLKQISEEYQREHGSDVGSMRVSDLSITMKTRSFPLRTLTLYLLHAAALKGDVEFVSQFASCLQPDVSEWLSTYLTRLWIQMGSNTPLRSLIAPACLGSTLSPLRLLKAWFADIQSPIDTWCSKTIMNEISLHDSLFSRHFADVMDFINACKKWVDCESVSIFREKFVEYVTKRPSSVGAHLFDYCREGHRFDDFDCRNYYCLGNTATSGNRRKRCGDEMLEREDSMELRIDSWRSQGRDVGRIAHETDVGMSRSAVLSTAESMYSLEGWDRHSDSDSSSDEEDARSVVRPSRSKRCKI